MVYSGSPDSVASSGQCTVCSKDYRTPSGLKRHMAIHGPLAGLYKCPYPGCEYRTLGFRQPIHLTNHVASKHEPWSRPWKCGVDDCPQAFNDAATRTRHRRRKHPGSVLSRSSAPRPAKPRVDISAAPLAARCSRCDASIAVKQDTELDREDGDVEMDELEDGEVREVTPPIVAAVATEFSGLVLQLKCKISYSYTTADRRSISVSTNAVPSPLPVGTPPSVYPTRHIDEDSDAPSSPYQAPMYDLHPDTYQSPHASPDAERIHLPTHAPVHHHAEASAPNLPPH